MNSTRRLLCKDDPLHYRFTGERLFTDRLLSVGETERERERERERDMLYNNKILPILNCKIVFNDGKHNRWLMSSLSDG